MTWDVGIGLETFVDFGTGASNCVRMTAYVDGRRWPAIPYAIE